MTKHTLAAALAATLLRAACGGKTDAPAEAPKADGFGDKVLEMRRQGDAAASQIQGAMEQSVQQADQEADKAK